MFEFLAAARFAHFAAICILFGLAAFPFYAVGPAEETPRFDGAIRWSAVLALLTAWIVLLAMTANIGGSAASAFDPGVLSAVAGDTRFGQVWVARILLAVVVLAACVKRKARPGRDKPLLILSGLLLASVALTGHSALPGGVPGILHTFADIVHLLAAGWWVGGLLALVLLARSLGDRALPTLERFSGVGYGMVAAIILTGLFKSALLVASIPASVSTAYGWVLLAKIGLAASMGLLALSNRFWITPALKRMGPQPVWLGRLHWQVSVEFAVGLAVLAAAGILGAMSPPISN